MMTDRGDYLEFYERDPSDIRKEVVHQIEAFSHVSNRYPMWLCWHSVNENKKTMYTALIDQQSGLHKGVSDLVMLIGFQGCNYPFAAIEMKRVNKSGKGKASPVSKEQKDFLAHVRKMGGFSAVCYGSEQFKIAIQYMLSQH